MGTVSEWDSLSFVAVFTGVAEALDLDLDEDDAIHFTSIEAMHDFLSELMAP
jgi:acyl carrier protein